MCRKDTLLWWPPRATRGDPAPPARAQRKAVWCGRENQAPPPPPDAPSRESKQTSGGGGSGGSQRSGGVRLQGGRKARSGFQRAPEQLSPFSILRVTQGAARGSRPASSFRDPGWPWGSGRLAASRPSLGSEQSPGRLCLGPQARGAIWAGESAHTLPILRNGDIKK